MERQALINRVKIKMDEFTPEGVDTPFEDYIGPVLDECARELLERASLHLLTPTAIPVTSGDPPVSTIIYYNDKAYIPVPADYVKLYEIRFPEWQKSVRRAISVEDPEYKIQENQYAKGGNARPYVALITTQINGGSTNKYFECGYVEDPDPETLTPIALYVAECKPEQLPDIFADAISWGTAARLFGIMGENIKAQMTLEQYKNSMLSITVT